MANLPTATLCKLIGPSRSRSKPIVSQCSRGGKAWVSPSISQGTPHACPIPSCDSRQEVRPPSTHESVAEVASEVVWSIVFHCHPPTRSHGKSHESVQVGTRCFAPAARSSRSHPHVHPGPDEVGPQSQGSSMCSGSSNGVASMSGDSPKPIQQRGSRGWVCRGWKGAESSPEG